MSFSVCNYLLTIISVLIKVIVPFRRAVALSVVVKVGLCFW